MCRLRPDLSLVHLSLSRRKRLEASVRFVEFVSQKCGARGADHSEVGRSRRVVRWEREYRLDKCHRQQACEIPRCSVSYEQNDELACAAVR